MAAVFMRKVGMITQNIRDLGSPTDTLKTERTT